MAQTGYTPILIYASGTTGNTPSAANLTSSASGAELAINYFDGKLFYKDNSGVVQVLATKGTGAIGGSNTQVQYNSSGALAGSANLTFDGTTLTANALTVTNNPTLSGGTANGVVYLNGSKVATSGSALTFDGTNAATTGTSSATKFIPTGGTATGNGMYLSAANTLAWSTNGTKQLELDSSGNLGLGVTPSAWATSGTILKAVQIGAAGSVAAGTVDASIHTSQNAYFDGTNWKYIQTATAGNYYINGNSHVWRIAPSGTAGNAISFTQAMTLDASGNLLVGVTSATSGSRLAVKTSGSTSATYGIYFYNSASTILFTIEDHGRWGTGTGTAAPYNNTTASAANMYVENTGYIYRSTSSLKYKTDVQDATHGLSEVMQLRPVTYKGKNDGDKVFGGLIAEEVHAAGLTEFVQYAEDGSPDALAYGNMVSLLTKAIQEQQALITDLRARVQALEAQP